MLPHTEARECRMFHSLDMSISSVSTEVIGPQAISNLFLQLFDFSTVLIMTCPSTSPLAGAQQHSPGAQCNPSNTNNTSTTAPTPTEGPRSSPNTPQQRLNMKPSLLRISV